MADESTPTPRDNADRSGNDGAVEAPLQGFQAGDTIGKRYEVLKRLGQGGMGVVYLVHDKKLNRKLALKTLLPEFSGKARAAQRFEREVQLARQLDHPCIVKIYDAWRVGDLLMYTMEFVEGQSLRQALYKKKRMGLGSTVRILSMLLHALHHAHAYTIHRDLSPDNVMLTLDGGIKLLDFGLAKPMERQNAFTMIGVNLGKAQYNAPEQQLNARDVDHRADLYSVGIMFYEMLTGVLPDRGIQTPLLTLRPDLPVECEVFLEKATAPKAEDRFDDAREMRKILEQVYAVSKSRGINSDTPPPVEADAHITAVFHRPASPGEPEVQVIDLTARRVGLMARLGRWLSRMIGPREE